MSTSTAEQYFFNGVYALLALVVLLFAYSTFGRIINVDSAILGEPTYWLSHEGVLRSELQRGWAGAEQHFFFSHKLFLYFGAVFVRLFGFSSTVLNLVSLFFSGILVWCWFKIFRFYKLEQKWFLLFLTALLINRHIFEFAFLYRPEIALAALSSWCVYFLILHNESKRMIHLILAALFAAVAVGFHLNGVIFVASGFFVLAFRKEFWPAFVFGLIGTFGLCFHLLDIRSLSDLQTMFLQFRSMQDIGKEHVSAIHYLLNIPMEQQRFLHSPVEIGFTLLFLPIVIWCFKSFRAGYGILLSYIGLCVYFLALIAHGKDSKYLILYIPILTFFSVLGIRRLFQTPTSTKLKLFFAICISLFLVGQGFGLFPFALIKETRIEAYKKIGAKIPRGSNVLGPVYAAFWAIPSELRLQSFFVYQVLAAHDNFTENANSISIAARYYQIDWILFDSETWEKYQMTETSLPDYELVNSEQSEHLRLFHRKPSAR